ncbi:hypothetical protein PACTADRAFT_38684 [Pachysolen tannophilus NRRL Y-2460]|uniref:Uncharacterized protein n=1 Tax=Pachysolen tannophilus NRRL Y-2460 TaxID=669874 RepID=A0A1E4TXT0_PACTA|nr:hypothetical protein PACTADRAFT_38684 [Pachysolen tannophilus NRRL Y-2460]
MSNFITKNPGVDEEILAFPAGNRVVQPQDGKLLKLSGRILNVMTTIPNQIYRENCESEWNVRHLRGNSSLYSSNYFLEQQTDWESHLIAWTGELTTIDDFSVKPTGSKDSDPLYLNDDDKQKIEKKIHKANNSDKIHPVWLLRRDQNRWTKYAENILWPVFHYIQGDSSNGRAEADWWYDYVKFNEAYAAKIRSIYKPGDIIWIHDYYLLLLPQILRMDLPEAYIGLYIHAPFPSSEYFRCIAKRKHLLDGMLGANQIGFQSYSFARHFVSCCARLLGCEVKPDSITAYGAHVAMVVLPIGIDTVKIQHDAFQPTIEEKMKAIKELNQNKKIIIGRDRLDSVRGVVQKLEAFEMFLSMYPEWRDKVVLIQVSSPTPYHTNKIEKKVNEIVSNINGTYGSLNSTPVQHYQMRIEKDEYLALLRVADLGLITSIRDGMNTTSLEFVICQKDNHSPLILSEFSGSAAVLTDAILVNPWDSVGVAKSIHDCLSMQSETKAFLENKLYKEVSKNTIQDWTSNFLRSLIENLNENVSIHGTPYLNRPLLLQSYQSAQRRLFLFDYDGTLTPIVKEPSAAIPSGRLKGILNELLKDPKNQIWIISGRDQAFLDKWLGSENPQLGLSAEHGCFMKGVNEVNWINLAESFDMSWQKEVQEIFTKYTDKTPGAFIEFKKVAITWHYRKADPDFGEFQALKCKNELLQTVALKYDVEIMSGKANLEVRPKFVNKGEIVKKLVLKAHGQKQDPTIDNSKQEVSFEKLPDFILCLGDDLTDEDMFSALNKIESTWEAEDRPKNMFKNYGIHTVTVGPANKQTVAKAFLSDSHQVLDTLGLLVGQVSIFETGGSVELDDRGHLKNSESSERAEAAIKAHTLKRNNDSISKSSGK